MSTSMSRKQPSYWRDRKDGGVSFDFMLACERSRTVSRLVRYVQDMCSMFCSSFSLTDMGNTGDVTKLLCCYTHR